MEKQIHRIEISLLKCKGAVELNAQCQTLTDEENRLMGLLTDEDSGSTPELRAVQEQRFQKLDELIELLNNKEEITYFRGYSFIAKYFDKEGIFYGNEFDITQEHVAQFITECNLVLENPEVGESILPIIPSCEVAEYAEDDEYHEEPIYYNDEYIANVRHAKEVFNDILVNTDWTKDAIYLQIIC